MTRCVWAGLVLAVAAALMSSVWRDWRATAAVVTVVLSAYVLVLLAGRLGAVPAWTAWLVCMIAATVGQIVTFKEGGLVNAVPKLLSSAQPTPFAVELLVPVLLLATVVGSWVGVKLARSAGGMVTVPFAATVLYVAGALLTAGRGDRYGLGALVLLLMLCAGWVLQGERVRWPHLPAAAGICVVAFVAGALAAPSADPYDPRRTVQSPTLMLTASSPLPRLTDWALHPDRELLRVRVTSPARLRYVALTELTGAGWRAQSLYHPFTSESRGEPPMVSTVLVDMQVTVTDLPGSWLPVPGTFVEEISPAANVVIDPRTGSVAVRRPVAAGTRYRVRGRDVAPDAIALAAASAPHGARFQEFTAIPELPSRLYRYAHDVTEAASGPYEMARRLEHAIADGRRFDATAPAGSSLARIETFLFGDVAAPGAMAGTSEQFATAFVLLARSVGLPTRLMVGFREGEPSGGEQVVRGRHAAAWPEVYFTDVGWVVFDLTPLAGTDTDPGQPTAHPESSNRPEPARTSGDQPEAAIVRPRIETTGWPRALAGGVAGTLAGGLILVVLLRAVRRLRHRRSGPCGAWSEVLDMCVLLRQPVEAALSAPALAARLTAVLPRAGRPARLLAEAADRAAFAPADSVAIPTDIQAWMMVSQLRRAVARSIPWYRRLVWMIDPRPLLRR